MPISVVVLRLKNTIQATLFRRLKRNCHSLACEKLVLFGLCVCAHNAKCNLNNIVYVHVYTTLYAWQPLGQSLNLLFTITEQREREREREKIAVWNRLRPHQTMTATTTPRKQQYAINNVHVHKICTVYTVHITHSKRRPSQTTLTKLDLENGCRACNRAICFVDYSVDCIAGSNLNIQQK